MVLTGRPAASHRRTPRSELYSPDATHPSGPAASATTGPRRVPDESPTATEKDGSTPGTDQPVSRPVLSFGSIVLPSPTNTRRPSGERAIAFTATFRRSDHTSRPVVRSHTRAEPSAPPAAAHRPSG